MKRFMPAALTALLFVGCQPAAEESEVPPVTSPATEPTEVDPTADPDPTLPPGVEEAPATELPEN